MATAPEELQPNEDELDPNAPPQEDEPEQPPSVEELAQQMGWVPQDQFKGPAEKWKPAHQFVLDGHDIQRTVSKELRELKSTVDVMSRTSASIVEQNIAERRRELEQAHNQAVEDGDPAEARKISQAIDRLSETSVPRPVNGVDEWKRKNSWYEKDPLATDLALETCERLARQGFGHAEQLEAAERKVRKEFPELFNDAPAQRPPAVRAPQSRQATPPAKVKGFHDMPRAAQDTATEMAGRGVIKSVDDYVKNYWIQVEKAARN